MKIAASAAHWLATGVGALLLAYVGIEAGRTALAAWGNRR